MEEKEIPYFSWDRALTVAQIKKQLRDHSGLAWCRTAAWIMREAAFPDVWIFLTPQEVWNRFDQLEPFLGRKKTFWDIFLKPAMDWEKSRAATPLKRDFLKVFFEKNQAFYLTGGSALGIFCLHHRISTDFHPRLFKTG